MANFKELEKDMNVRGSYFPLGNPFLSPMAGALSSSMLILLPGASYRNPMGVSAANDNINSVDSISGLMVDTSADCPTASTVNEPAEAMIISNTPLVTDSVSYDKSTLFPNLALELRFMVVEEALPAPAILGTLFRHLPLPDVKH